MGSNLPSLCHMKRVFLLAALIFCLVPSSSQGAEAAADDLYIKIFDLIMTADGLQSDGQGRHALEKYMEADRDLKGLKSAYRKWNPSIVNYRLKYLADKMGRLKVQYPGTIIPTQKVDAVDPNEKNKGVVTALENLNDQLVSTGRKNSTLRDQLREALAARPAASDPAEYAIAQGRIRELEQLSDVSSITIGQQGVDLKKLRVDYTDLQQRLEAMEERSMEPRLRDENKNLKEQVSGLNKLTKKLSSFDDLKRQVSLLETDLKNSEGVSKNLSKQNGVLRKEIASNDVEKLRQSNASLQSRLAELNKIAGTFEKVEDVTRKLSMAEADLKIQRSLAKELTNQNEDLEAQVRKAEIPKLKSENQALKGKVAELAKLTRQMPSIEKLQNDLAAAKAKAQAEKALRAEVIREKEKLEALLTDPNAQIGQGTPDEVKALESEKKALEQQLLKLAAEKKKSDEKSSALNQQSSAKFARLKQLERERVELQKALQDALKNSAKQEKDAKKSSQLPASDSEVKKKSR